MLDPQLGTPSEPSAHDDIDAGEAYHQVIDVGRRLGVVREDPVMQHMEARWIQAGQPSSRATFGQGTSAPRRHAAGPEPRVGGMDGEDQERDDERRPPSGQTRSDDTCTDGEHRPHRAPFPPMPRGERAIAVGGRGAGARHADTVAAHRKAPFSSAPSRTRGNSVRQAGGDGKDFPKSILAPALTLSR